MEHTKEPWVLMAAGDEVERQVVVADRTSLLTIVYEDETAFAAVYSDADARRIVACVNACAGIPTDDLERFGLAALNVTCNKVAAQRDELLAAVKTARIALQVGAPEYDTNDVFDILSEAIAKIEQQKE